MHSMEIPCIPQAVHASYKMIFFLKTATNAVELATTSVKPTILIVEPATLVAEPISTIVEPALLKSNYVFRKPVVHSFWSCIRPEEPFRRISCQIMNLYKKSEKDE